MAHARPLQSRGQPEYRCHGVGTGTGSWPLLTTLDRPPQPECWLESGPEQPIACCQLAVLPSVIAPCGRTTRSRNLPARCTQLANGAKKKRSHHQTERCAAALRGSGSGHMVMRRSQALRFIVMVTVALVCWLKWHVHAHTLTQCNTIVDTAAMGSEERMKQNAMLLSSRVP